MTKMKACAAIITFYDEGTYILNYTRDTYEIDKGKTIMRRLGL